MLSGLKSTMLGILQYVGFAVLAVVCIVLLVLAIRWLLLIGRRNAGRDWKDATGLGICGFDVKGVPFGRSKYGSHFTLRRDNGNAYWYELHLPANVSGGYRRRVNEFPESFIHVPGFVVGCRNPLRVLSLLYAISRNRGGMEIGPGSRSDDYGKPVRGYWSLMLGIPTQYWSRALYDWAVGESKRTNGRIRSEIADAKIVVMNEAVQYDSQVQRALEKDA